MSLLGQTFIADQFHMTFLGFSFAHHLHESCSVALALHNKMVLWHRVLRVFTEHESVRSKRQQKRLRKK
jgi:hypothetical protein